MSANLLEKSIAQKAAHVTISAEEAKRLKTEVLEMRRNALKFAQRAQEIGKILDVVINASIDS